jgi:hypothetical protein
LLKLGVSYFFQVYRRGITHCAGFV